ncbi:MAG: integral rane sensor signal transduction histidine kinase [Paenibacillaceae bacterium]|jgi:two-component system sensor histidine kinase YesM|nr:integral rane sensor signal transduction histidine kinase [Paenibacillaceae bacterium]
MKAPLKAWGTKAALLVEEMTLQKKLIIAYIGIIFIPIIIFSVMFYNSNYQRTIEELMSNSEFVLALEEANIGNNMELMERTAQITVSSKEMGDYLYADMEFNAEQLIEFDRNTNKSLQRQLFNNPNLANIRIFSSNPHVLEIWPMIFKESRIADKPWRNEVMSRKGMVFWEISRMESDPAGNRVELTDYVSLFRELQNPLGAHGGILEVDMKLEQFFSRSFGGLQDEQSQMVVIHRNGNLFRNHSGQGRDDLPQSRILQLAGDYLGGGDPGIEFKHGGNPYLGTFKRIDRLDALLLNIVSLREPLTEIRQTRNNLVLFACVLIVILSLITYFTQSLILKKLHILKDSMKKVRQGNFNIDIKIGPKGEIGELAFHFRKMVSTINELIAEAVNKQAATKEAELNSLKNQINSHFLYNTLENLKMLAEIEEQYTISDALTSLGSMMRYSMKWNGNQVQLSEEIAHIRNYISIMNIRYDGRLELKVDIPPGHMNQEVPKMSLQPIVENSLQHGLHPQLELLTVTIHSTVSSGLMLIGVSDNGTGLPPHKAAELNAVIRMDDAEFQVLDRQRSDRDGGKNGIGLRNVNQRIMMYCGNEYGLFVDSMEGCWTRVTIRLPYFILSGGLSIHEESAGRG